MSHQNIDDELSARRAMFSRVSFAISRVEWEGGEALGRAWGMQMLRGRQETLKWASGLMLTCFVACLLLIAAPIEKAQEAPQSGAADQATELQKAADERRKQEIEFLIAVAAAIAGAIFGGYFAVEGALKGVREAERLTREREQENAEKLRETLRSEIQCNADALKRDQEITEPVPNGEDAWNWLAIHPCPVWSTAVWQQSVAPVSRAMKKDELLNVQKFYAALGSMTSARETLGQVARENAKPQIFAAPLVERVAELRVDLERLRKALRIE